MTRIVDRDLETLRDLTLRMGSLSEGILAKSLRALSERNPDLASQVQEDDLEIDRLDVAIDAAVLEILATKAPVATDLRFVISTKAVATDLERVGDLARNIAKSAARIASLELVEIPPRLETLASESQRLLRKALDCYADTNADLARRVIEQDELIDASESRVIRDAVAAIAAHPERSSQEVDLILVAKNLERVADHATNIAEDVILTAESLNIKHGAKLQASKGRQP
jgi:phosphate transport system protein